MATVETTRVQQPDVPAESRDDLVSVLARRVLPWLMVIGTLVALVRWAAQPLTNPDTYFHLRFGHEFLNGWSLRHPGHVTSWATGDWVPTQWLPQVVMAKTEDWFGLAGVAWLSGLMFLGLALSLLLAGRRFASLAVTAPLVIICLLADSVSLSMRPQVLSYFATVLVMTTWMRFRDRLGGLPWLLVPLLWVWAMCHGMWPVGVVISVAAVGGLVLDGHLRGPRIATSLAVPIGGAVAACLLTPVGPALLPAVLTVNSRGQYFSEWAPPHFTSPNCLAALALFFIALLAASRQRMAWFDLTMLVLAGAFLVYSARTVPVAACMLTPLAALHVQRLLPTSSRASARERLGLIGMAAAALVVLGLVVPSTSAASQEQPSWLDPALSALPAGTRIYDEMSFGGYLMWRYPDLDFMASGYGDIYTTRQLQDLNKIGEAQPGWDKILKDARPALALVAPDSPVAYALVHQEQWRVVDHSKHVELLEPPSGWADSR